MAGFISIKDIQKFRNCTTATACRDRQLIAKALDKKPKSVTFQDYCDYHKIKITDILVVRLV